MSFKLFKAAVAKQFAVMQQHSLYRTTADKDALWALYLSSFPEGSNPIFRKRTEHDCACCKQFIRVIGNVVAVIDDQVISIWDIQVDNPAYQAVADALATEVKCNTIVENFLHYEKTVGTDLNRQLLKEQVLTWEHFFVNLPVASVKRKDAIPTLLGEARSLCGVFKRGLTEITDDAIDTVLDLIAQNSLYRGEEHKHAVVAFKELKQKYSKLSGRSTEVFVWSHLNSVPASVAAIRNTVIGTLLTELSEGKELEAAVGAFEAKVAPTNYKRPTALVSKAMIEKAQATINELGLSSALARRYAKLDDITINNILFANRDARKVISGDVFDQLAAKTSDKVQNMDKIEEITIDKFISDVLPKADTVEVLLENKLVNNLVSLIAPEDPTAGHLFKWDNNFSWSYNGEVTDSIKERVKAAGGAIEGYLCCRLAWDYADDLDFHMHEANGNCIYFGNRRQTSACGGMLDVDANGADGPRANPVENIFYKTNTNMKEGLYRLAVKNFTRRSDGRGFEVEVEFGGNTFTFSHAGALRTGESMDIVQLQYTKVNGLTIAASIPSTQTSKELWGIPSQTFHQVNVMMMSPNYWDDKAQGNKHYFFMLQDCKNPGKARGFYNEFLNSAFDTHRKVFEIVGSTMKTDESEQQLSGLGFSSTQKSSVVVRVKGSFTRNLKINF